MGAYINPPNKSKEAWLEEHGTLIESEEELHSCSFDTHMPVCLVDNGLFTAAGIAYDKQELKAFLYSDGRPKTWYLVEVEKLPDVSNINKYSDKP